jgi:hypothetical protein
MLKRQGVIEAWHDRRITAGEEFDGAIGEHVENDDIIVLLVSPDFLASSYCYDIEMTRAMERHEAREAIVIPVILRACEWHHAPFGKLTATPPDGRPVTQWPDKDQAFLEVAKAIRKAAERLNGGAGSPAGPISVSRPQVIEQVSGAAGVAVASPRSSNLALSKRFTDRDKDAFRIEAFDYIASYFENSLAELGKRNDGIEGAFRRVDANRFFATAYRDGNAVARMTVFMGGMFRESGISHTLGETMAGNSFNETLSIDADDQSLFLRSMGLGSGRGEPKLTFEGAAELFWSTFIQPLQRR